MATASTLGAPPRDSAEDFLQRSPALFEAAFGVDASRAEHFALLMTLRQRVEADLQRVLRRFSLTQTDYQTLAVLRVQGRGFEIAPRELARIIGLTSAGMTSALDRLDAAGYVERTPHPTDRRSILVQLTEQGWRDAERVCRAVCDRQTEILEAATPEQVDESNAQLRRMIASFDR